MLPFFWLMLLLVSTAGAADLDWVEAALVDRTERILEDPGVGATLRADAPLYEAYRRALAIAFARPEAFEHVLADAERATPRFYRALRVEGMPEPLARVLAFAAAHPGEDRSWSLVENTDGEEVCGRGPLALTYTQGYWLGLGWLQGDALIEGGTEPDHEVVVHQLVATFARIAGPTSFDHDLIRCEPILAGAHCCYVDGDDDRMEIPALAADFVRRFGPGARGAPAPDEPHAALGRLVLLPLLDHRRRRVTLEGDRPPSEALSDLKPSRAELAMDAAATVLARAVAVPCLAVLEGWDVDPELQDLAEPADCAILRAFVRYDQARGP